MDEDGLDFLSEVGERWGELCRTAPRASRAADELISAVRLSWSPEHRGYFHGTSACLSCLLATGRHQELLELIATAPFVWWHYRRYGVLAFAAQSQRDEAIAYAEVSLGLNDSPAAMAWTCEEVLLAAGRPEEAYRRYALVANRLDRQRAWAMVKRRARKAGIDTPGICNHTFRGTGITAYLGNPEAKLEHAQQMAAHSDPKTTRLYDRRSDQVSLDEVERIGI